MKKIENFIKKTRFRYQKIIFEKSYFSCIFVRLGGRTDKIRIIQESNRFYGSQTKY